MKQSMDSDIDESGEENVIVCLREWKNEWASALASFDELSYIIK